MSEHLSHNLPEGMTEDDLRYVNPQLLSLEMGIRGWNTHIEQNVDDNRYKVFYRMSRPLDISFEVTQLAELQEHIGVIDEEGQVLDGYSLRVDTFGEDRTFLEAHHDAIHPFLDSSNYLIFEFEGFPTDKTMDVMQELYKSFEPKEIKGIIARFLGRLGIGKNPPPSDP